MADETSSNGVADEGTQVGCNEGHLFVEVGLEGLAVFEEVDDAVGKVSNVDEVDGGNVSAHGGAGCVNDALGLLLVVQDVGQLANEGVFVLFVSSASHSDGNEFVLVADGLDDLGILVVVGNDLDEFGEVPAVPLSDAHGELVDVLVKLVEHGNGLNDHVVGAMDVELDLGAGVGVTETQAGLDQVVGFEAGQKLLSMKSETSDEGESAVRGVAVYVEGGFDGASEAALLDAEKTLGALGREMLLEHGLQVRVKNTF